MIELEHVICTTIKNNLMKSQNHVSFHNIARIRPNNSVLGSIRLHAVQRLRSEYSTRNYLTQKRDDASLKIPSYLIIRSSVGRATLSVMFERRFHTKRGISVTINLACINRESKNIRSPSRIFFITLHIYVTFTILPFFYFIFLALNSFSLFH